MTGFQKFEDIDAWRMARVLAREIYEMSGEGAFCRDFALRDQMRRAAVSVASNIAEGFERKGRAEFVQFLSIAKGSAAELRAQLYIALDWRLYRERKVHRNLRAHRRCKRKTGRVDFIPSSRWQ